jgi:hypothetical protein
LEIPQKARDSHFPTAPTAADVLLQRPRPKTQTRRKSHYPWTKNAGAGQDYALGAAPHTGAFVVVYEDKPLKQAQLGYVKMGDGPFYVFYTPYHLPHIQIISTIGRAVVHSDPTVRP